MTDVAMQDGEPKPLPALREELTILPASADHFGRPRWMIYDPVRHCYFSIGEQMFRALNA